MRMAFGLVSLLVTLGVIIMFMHYVWLPNTKADLDAGAKAQVEVQQISGRDDTGTPIEETYALAPDYRPDNKLQDLQVANILAGSPLQKHFGLQKNDIIIAAVDGHGVRTDMAGSTDEESAKLAVREAYVSGSGQLYIKRGDVMFLLNDGKAPMMISGATTPPPPTASGQPTPPPAAQQRPNPVDSSDPMQELNRRIHPVGF